MVNDMNHPDLIQSEENYEYCFFFTNVPVSPMMMYLNKYAYDMLILVALAR